jgi:hypothetical protein
MEPKKHEPVTIDVTPDKVEIERPRERVVRVHSADTRRTIKQMRELERMGEIVQQPNFWLGLIAEMWRTRR